LALAVVEAAVVAELAVVAEHLVLVHPVVAAQHLAHKLLPLVRLQVAVVLAVLPEVLPEEPEVAAAALLLVQGLVASESPGSR
jgi:hypothetical protein